MIEYILATDATSYMRVNYAKKGDTVKLIMDCGRALIVENKSGTRFPITTNHLINYGNENIQPELTPKEISLEKRQDPQLRGKKANKLHARDRDANVPTLF